MLRGGCSLGGGLGLGLGVLGGHTCTRAHTAYVSRRVWGGAGAGGAALVNAVVLSAVVLEDVIVLSSAILIEVVPPAVRGTWWRAGAVLGGGDGNPAVCWPPP